MWCLYSLLWTISGEKIYCQCLMSGLNQSCDLVLQTKMGWGLIAVEHCGETRWENRGFPVRTQQYGPSSNQRLLFTQVRKYSLQLHQCRNTTCYQIWLILLFVQPCLPSALVIQVLICISCKLSCKTNNHNARLKFVVESKNDMVSMQSNLSVVICKSVFFNMHCSYR